MLSHDGKEVPKVYRLSHMGFEAYDPEVLREIYYLREYPWIASFIQLEVNEWTDGRF